MSKYSSIKNKYEVVAVVFDGRVIKRNIQRSFNLNRDFLNRYAESLKSKSNYCTECSYPIRLICANNTYVKSDKEYFESNELKKELIDYCYKMEPNNYMKCERNKRQKFMTNKLDPDYCLSKSKKFLFTLTIIISISVMRIKHNH